ncbi:hypothetical protein SGGMMB4_03298 [Sodalis glossinidius str. 'morsitans']|uniref:Uncharacterized protein n=1 Tax=Sodalis glossinidius (strain morsitans) TaxID=343509 RepID=A0A193QJZ2_SODGM|nr:hypothetical protein SGGMMB4_03298 [Sodalis glossinidius str. 'morsitans']
MNSAGARLSSLVRLTGLKAELRTPRQPPRAVSVQAWLAAWVHDPQARQHFCREVRRPVAVGEAVSM